MSYLNNLGNLSIKRIIISGVMFCILLLILLGPKNVLNPQDITGLKGILFALILFLDPESHWNENVYLLILILIYFLVGAFSGAFIRKVLTLFFIWLLFSFFWFVLGIVSLIFIPYW